MRKAICTSLLIFIGYFSIAQQSHKSKQELYPILENEMWGYINKAGEEVIEPQFYSAGPFSGELAPVRIQGTYGFINKKGNIEIAPKYDLAYSFNEGIAKVYIDAKPYLINTKGEKLFEHNYIEIIASGKKNIFITQFENDKYGLIDNRGNQLIKDQYDQISPFANGRSVVTKNRKVALIDKHGNLVIPFGKFLHISTFKNGYAKVKLNHDSFPAIKDDSGFIDINGNLKFTIPYKIWHFGYGNNSFSNGLAPINIYTVDIDTLKTWSSDDRHYYKGVINTEGEILFSNKEWDEITAFRKGVAFVKDMHQNIYLINTKGETLNAKPYKNLVYSNLDYSEETLFQNGIEFVETEKGWGVIKPDGKFIIKPRTFDFEFDKVIRAGDILIFRQYIRAEGHEFPYQYGFWNIKQNVLIKPQFKEINLLNKSSLIHVVKNDISSFISSNGKQVWKQRNNEKNNKIPLNIDFMNRGYFYASSPYKEELAGNGGWASSENSFRKMNSTKNFGNDNFGIFINPNERELFKKKYKGIKLYIFNKSEDTVYFNAQDSRLYLKIQAKTKKGIWKDIEYLPSSWCGNSYHNLFLPSNYYWEFVTPLYEGDFKTQLRAKLLYKHTKKGENITIFSNTFEASINPAQFWRKVPYRFANIMNPYKD